MNNIWTDYLDLRRDRGGVELFALQFAYRDRIINNDVVYMLDEVGSGKTVSAGIMMLEWLNNEKCQNKKALVITTPSQARGLYAGDLEDKFGTPLRRLKASIGGSDVYEVINYHYKNIEKHSGADEKYGIVIIDEAQEFLITPASEEDDKLRVKALMNVRAEKVVFASATPIKYGLGDIREYVKLAKCILGQIGDMNNLTEQENMQIDAETKRICGYLSNKGRDKMDLIAASFDTSCPVTRYFKDTIKCLQIGKYRKNRGKRTVELWKYDYSVNSDQVEQLVDRIEKVVNSSEGSLPSRCVVFVYRRDDTRLIADRCKEKGISATAVVGDEYGREELKKISNIYNANKYNGQNYRDEELPKVLVITYKMANAGVNLPRYNYVINYYVPGYTADLEQMFGRVDRLNTEYENIHMCYYLGTNKNSQKNFYSAFNQYIYNLVSMIPVRNVLLDHKILEEVFAKQDDLAKWMLEDKAYYEGLLQNITGTLREIQTPDNVQDDRLLELATAVSNEIPEMDYNENIDDATYELAKESLSKIISKKIVHCEKQYNSLIDKKFTDIEKDNLIKMVDAVGDKIFYFTGDITGRESWSDMISQLKIIDPIECADTINESEEYRLFSEKFDTDVKIPFVVEHLHELYDSSINEMLEDEYRENIFTLLYCMFNYSRINDDVWKKIWGVLPEYTPFLKCLKKNKECASVDMKLWNELSGKYDIREFFLNVEPFRSVIDEVRNNFIEEISDKKGYVYRRFDNDPIFAVYNRMVELHNPLDDRTIGFVTEEMNDGQYMIKATPFYKLIFLLFGNKNYYCDLIYNQRLRNNLTLEYSPREYMSQEAFDKEWLAKDRIFMAEDNLTKEMISAVALGPRREKACERILTK